MIALRYMQPEDKEMVRSWRNSDAVSKYMHTSGDITPQEHTRWFDRVLADRTCKYWIVTFHGEPVGVVNLYNIDLVNQRCYWSFYIGNIEMRGKGIGTFVEYEILRIVFEELKLNKLCGEILSWNEVILRIHDAFGYRREGYLREHIIKEGKCFDVVVIGMLRREWEANKSRLEQELRAKNLLSTSSEN